MSDTKQNSSLAAVYGAKNSDEIAHHYDRWAQNYEADMAAAGYRHPSICLALAARYLPRGVGTLLDAGCGTGLVGEWLTLLGYASIEGLDISEGMLAVAAQKGVYKKLHTLALGKPLPFLNGTFAGIVAVGVFTSGHVGAEGLDELIRICRPSGAIIMTVKITLMNDSIKARLREYEAEGRIAILEMTEPYVSMPGETGTLPSYGLVFRVN